MHKTIYFNNRPLILCDEETETVKSLLAQPHVIVYRDLKEESVADMIRQMQQPDVNGGVYLHSDVEQLMDVFKKKMLLIQAAGGLVHTDNNTFLLIFRRGKWDLPKGKLDEGENLEQCAIREVEEETGLHGVQLERPLTITYHTYYQDNQLILKESHWYLMKSLEQQVLTPQLDEDIEECKWVHKDVLTPYMENTHPSIIDVLKEAVQQLHIGKEI
jgi:8-oxo-dGTP pyrophosphatase MutT (NUDIX family)